MSKTTKLWISDKLELRWNEWPKEPDEDDYDASGNYPAAMEAYNRALAKAKQNSILVDDLRIKMVVMKDAKRDTFVEYPGEMEVVDQIRLRAGNEPWKDAPQPFTEPKELYQTRKVARLKPVNKSQLDSAGEKIPDGHTQCPRCYGSGETAPDVTCKKCDGSGYVENPVNSAHGFSEGAEFNSDSTKVFPAGTGMYFPEKQIEDLKSKLDTSNARIMELEAENKRLWNILHDATS